MKPQGMWMRREAFVVFCIVIGFILFVAPEYKKFQIQQQRHHLKMALTELSKLEHQFYLEHYFYAQTLPELGVSIPLYSEDNGYLLSIVPRVEKHHDFILQAIAQAENWTFDPKCKVVTLHHDGQWCAQGQCSGECWND